MPFNQRKWPVKLYKNWFHRLCSSSFGKSNGGANEFSHAAIIEVIFGKTSERALEDLRKQNRWYAFLWSWNCRISHWRQQPSVTQDNFAPTARCMQDTKKRQQVTRSSRQRLQCSVCHLHHEQAIRAPYRVRQIFAKNTARVPICAHFSSCRHVRRDATRGPHGTPIWRQTLYRVFSRESFLSMEPTQFRFPEHFAKRKAKCCCSWMLWHLTWALLGVLCNRCCCFHLKH